MLKHSKVCLFVAMFLVAGVAQAATTYSYVFDIMVDQCRSSDAALCSGFTPREFEQTWMPTAPLVSTYARNDLGVYIQDFAVTRAEGAAATATPYTQSFVDAGYVPAVTPQSWFSSSKASVFTPDDKPEASWFNFQTVQREIAPLEDENQNWIGHYGHGVSISGSRDLEPVRHFDRPYSVNELHRMLPTLEPLTWSEGVWRSFDDGPYFEHVYLGTATLQSIIAIPSIPEPETYAMYLAGLLLLVFAVRRKGAGAGLAMH
jgi:hypothetical protein